jgi:TPR repeat protein
MATMTTSEHEEQDERKEEEVVTTEPKNVEEEEGDECCICLEELPTDVTKFATFVCCGQGIHDHCYKDLRSMNMSGTCPYCRAKQPTSHEEIVKHLRPWVKKKKAWAQARMGEKYIYGEGVKQSHEMARRLLELATQQGNKHAMHNLTYLGYMYDTGKGKGVPISHPMAKRLWELSAQQGDTYAMYKLGFVHYTGRGYPQSYERAFEYYEQAAHLGQANAQYTLGNMYKDGQGVEKDLANAREWWAKAAAQGNKQAIARGQCNYPQFLVRVIWFVFFLLIANYIGCLVGSLVSFSAKWTL